MILLPPPQYDVSPPMPVIEQVLSWDEVQKACNAGRYFRDHNLNQASGAGLLGCAKTGVVWDVALKQFAPGNGCVIVYTGSANVRRHELAHCNGWPADHPGGFYRFNEP